MKEGKGFPFHCTLCGENFADLPSAHKHYNMIHHPDALAAAAAAAAAAKSPADSSSADEDKMELSEVGDNIPQPKLLHSCGHCFKQFTRAFCKKRHEQICPALAILNSAAPASFKLNVPKGPNCKKVKREVVPISIKNRKKDMAIPEVVTGAKRSADPSSSPPIKRGRGRPPKARVPDRVLGQVLQVKLPGISDSLGSPTMSQNMCKAMNLRKFSSESPSPSPKIIKPDSSIVITRSKNIPTPNIKKENRTRRVSTDTSRNGDKKVGYHFL